jgi:phage shock protein E
MRHLVVCLFVSLLVACSPATIAPSEAKELVKSGAVLVDVRTPEEFEAKHLPGAINIPVEDLDKRRAELPKEKDVVLYCRSGSRSARGRSVLLDSGFTRVHDLGAISNWK